MRETRDLTSLLSKRLLFFGNLAEDANYYNDLSYVTGSWINYGATHNLCAGFLHANSWRLIRPMHFEGFRCEQGCAAAGPVAAGPQRNRILLTKDRTKIGRHIGTEDITDSPP